MMIYPDIGLKDGRCVTLRRGQTVLPVVHAGCPVAIARAFAQAGAEWLNVVDLDARGRRLRDNTSLMLRIVREAGVPVQVGGGIFKLAHVDWWMDAGAAAVVIGPAAVLSPGLVREAATRHPFGVTLAIEIKAGRVMVEGWTEPSDHDPLAFARRFDGFDLAGVIVNDQDYDPAFPDAALARALRLGLGLATPVTVAGMVKSLDDIERLRTLGGLAGALVGRPLHEGAFTLAQAQAAASAPVEGWTQPERAAGGPLTLAS